MYTIKWLDVGDVSIPKSRAFYLGGDAEYAPTVALCFLLEDENGTLSLVDTGVRDPDEIDVGATSVNKWHVSDDQNLLDRLENLGISPKDIANILLTHLHYDHSSQVNLFPNAKIFVSRKELVSTIAPVNKRILSFTKYPWDIISWLVGENWNNLVTFDDLDEVIPGVVAHVVGGHTSGSTAYEVESRNKKYILAGDFISRFENLEEEKPSGLVVSLNEWFESLKRLRDKKGVIIPSHDPEIKIRFPTGTVRVE